MKEVKYITIYKKGDVHIVDMLQKDVLTSKSEIHVDRKFIDDICQEIQRITLIANRMLYEGLSSETRTDVVNNLKNTGEVLFKHLFPEDIQTALKESDASDLYLRLDEKLLHIPWELCFDGDEFISLKFRMGRQVLTKQKTIASKKSLEKEHMSMLIIIDPSETLKHAQKEAELLGSILENETDMKIELIGGRHANKLHLLKEMKGKDIVHFIGHSFYDENHIEKSGWILKDGLLTSEDISRMDSPPSFVFSNSCQSVATASLEGYLFDEKSIGVGGGFMIAGVRNFIGSIWVIHDESSVKFAADFYRAFVSDKTLGQSLQDAKRNVIKTDGLSNLLWASYMLYGDPSVKIVAKEEEVHNDTQKTYPQSIASGVPKRSILNLKTISILLISIILVLGYLYRVNWFYENREKSFFTDPGNTSLVKLYEYAYTIYKSGKIRGASELFEELILDDNNHLGLGYDGLAAIYFEEGAIEKAKEMIQKSFTKNPDNIMSHIIHGDILFTEGKRDKALTEYYQAIEIRDGLDWQKVRANNALGISFFTKGNINKAIESFQKSRLIEPEDTNTLFNLGVLSWKAGKINEARSYFEKVIERNPSEKLTNYYMIDNTDKVDETNSSTKKFLILPLSFDGGHITRMGAGEAIAWIMGEKLQEKNNLKIIRSSSLKAETELMEIGFRKLSDSITAINLGKVAKADYVIYGSYRVFENTIEADIRAVNIKTTEIVTIEHLKTRGEKKINDLAEIFARNISSKIEQ